MENNINATTPVFTWEDVTPTLIPNTTMQRRLRDGVPTVYKIVPIDGYVLRDKGRDSIIMDEETFEELGVKFGYTHMGTTCSVNYDFSTVTVTDENGIQHTAYGAREFFARPETEVPEDQIYSGGNNTEVM